MKIFTFYDSVWDRAKKNKRRQRLRNNFLVLFFALAWQTGFAQTESDYCIPTFSQGLCEAGVLIDNFVLQNSGINHIGSGCSPDLYGNFTENTDLFGSLYQGESYSFTVTAGLGNVSMLKIWIDFNGNGDFEDEGELLFSSPNNGAITGSITIPPNASLSTFTRLRVIISYLSAPVNSCPNNIYGEAHDYAVEILPSFECSTPQGLEVTEITGTSAELLWISDGTSFNIEWGESGFTQGSGTMVADINSPYILTDLNPMTDYEFYVRQNCGGDDGYSLWAGPYNFLTLCAPVDTFFEDFDTYPSGFSQETPYCWDRLLLNTAAQGISIGSASGTYHIRQYASNPSNWSIVVLPEVTNINSGTHRLRLKAWVNSGTGNLQAGYITDIADAETFVEVQLLTITNPTYEEDSEYIIVFPTTTPATARIAIRNPGTSNSQHFWDDVYWEVIPPCLSPTSLTTTNITQNTADLNWSGDGDLFDIEYGINGFSQGTGTIITGVTNNSYSLEDLNPGMVYQYYIRQDCGDDDKSLWSGPLSFITLCNPFDTITENFDSTLGATVPICWDRIISGTGIQNVLTTGEVYQNSSNPSNSTIVILPEVTNINSGTHWLRFKARVGSGISYTGIDHGVGNLQVGYITDITDASTFIEVSDLIITNTSYTADNAEYIVAFPTTAPANARIAIRNPGTLSSQHYWDDVFWESGPSCLPPTSVKASNVTQTTADLSWSGNGTLLDIEYGLSGFAQGTGIMITGITSDSYTLTDLNASAGYQYYIRQDCGNEDKSIWAGPFGFFTPCSPADTDTITENFDSYPTGTRVPHCWDRIILGEEIVGQSPIYQIIVGTGTNPNLSTDFALENKHISQYSFDTENVTVVVLPGVNNINADTHWLRFKARVNSGVGYLQVGYITDITDESTFVEVLPLTVTNTDYTTEDAEHIVLFPTDISPNARIAIRNPGTSGYGTILYWDDVYWESIPVCMYPLNLGTTNINHSTTNLFWSSEGTLFDIEYGLSGFTPTGNPTNASTTGVSNPYTLSGLTTGAMYQYYVRQDCGADDGVSVWTGPFEFKAGVYMEDIPTMLNANPQVDDVACATSFAIDVPEGQFLAGLTVQYVMTSASPALDSHQRSVLYSSTLGMGETAVVLPPNPQNYPGVVYYSRSVNFANGATGTIEFELKAWRTEGGSGCGTALVYVEDGSWVLNATFEDIPTCPNPPASLAYTNITEDSVDLIWTSEEDGTFQVKWGAVGFNVETAGTVISDIEAYSYTLSGLDSSIPYDFYVRRDCSDDDQEDFGEWVGPVRFNSGHCIPYATQGFYFTLFNTTNAVENVTYSNPGPALGTGYVNTDMIITESAGETFNFTSNYVGGASGLKIWVDWNNNFVFEDDEQVYFLASTNGNKSGAITVPAGTEPGDYRMRARAQQGATANPNACGLIVQGEAIDFTLRVPCDVIDAPTGDAVQYFVAGDTLAHLDVTGTGIVWYADEDLTTILDENTELVDAAIYYAVSMVGNCQSEALAITVEQVANISDFNSFGFTYYPNPVSELLYLSANAPISDVTVINMLGQQVNVSANHDNTRMDMSGLPTGNYLMKVTIEGSSKTIKIVKQ